MEDGKIKVVGLLIVVGSVRISIVFKFVVYKWIVVGLIYILDFIVIWFVVFCIFFYGEWLFGCLKM